MRDNILGLKIKQLRSNYSIKIGEKFTQKGLAEKLGITRSYLGDIESGRTKPNNELLKKIADFFNVGIDYFNNDDTHTKESNTFTNDIKDNDIRRIERAREKMNPEQKERMMKILESVFDDFFED